MSDKKKYDSTVARIAGNIAGHLFRDYDQRDEGQDAAIARQSVRLARLIVADVIRTEPEAT